jgi:hypothetical protein
MKQCRDQNYKVENTVVGVIVLQIITSAYAKCYDTNVSGNT